MFEAGRNIESTTSQNRLDLKILTNMPTELTYLSDTYLMNSTAMCQSVIRRGDGLCDVILDRTIFYPKGGGQPSDTGKIELAAGLLEVKAVSLSATGVVLHTCSLLSGNLPSEGEILDLSVNSNERMRNAANHTAGHLIDLALQLLPYKRDAIKANHSPAESWVQFNGDHLPPGETTDTIRESLTGKIDELIKQNLPTYQITPTAEQAAALGISAPAGKTVRIIGFKGYEDFARGCGGTHLASSGEVGAIMIHGIRARKGTLSVTYQTLN